MAHNLLWSFNGGYLRERSWFKVIQKIFRVFQNPHVIYATTRVNSFTIFLLSLLELGINSNTSSNSTYKPTSFDKDEILVNHRSFMTSLNIPSGKESEDLPYLYWIPKLHKTPYKERYIAGSSTCSMKELSIHLTKIMPAVKEGQQKYCERMICG
jgi:hypothetical protein